MVRPAPTNCCLRTAQVVSARSDRARPHQIAPPMRAVLESACTSAFAQARIGPICARWDCQAWPGKLSDQQDWLRLAEPEWRRRRMPVSVSAYGCYCNASPSERAPPLAGSTRAAPRRLACWGRHLAQGGRGGLFAHAVAQCGGNRGSATVQRASSTPCSRFDSHHE